MKTKLISLRKVILFVLISVMTLGFTQPLLAAGAGKLVTVMHYFTGELGRKGINQIFGAFQKQNKIVVFDNPIGHEDFKSSILIMAAGGNLPDMFSYWAGARTQFVVDSGQLQPIDDLWASNGLDAVIPKSIADGATMYNGKRYFIPFGYHYAGMFYNPKVMAKAGVTSMPKTWDQFLALCAKLKSAGINPIALGSKNRWPAQFWFDYLILRTAGPKFRADLMAGKVPYDDKRVAKAMEMWKDLTDKKYFVKFANADTWTDASDKVANGEAAMTLMGTWITGYWDGNKLKAGTDYDFFEFPTINPSVPKASVGPVDGFLLSKNAPNKASAEKLVSFLIKDTKSQAIWAKAQGALSPNKNVSTSNYSPVMQRALQVVNNSDTYAFNYDLATTPPVAEIGLSMFAEFMDNPSNYQQYLAKAQKAAKEIFDTQ
jgi:multiple sugar transport system substrate-binding protein/raffinose/stachyose/melibiose transport system substrate-binding protein